MHAGIAAVTGASGKYTATAVLGFLAAFLAVQVACQTLHHCVTILGHIVVGMQR